MRLIFKNIGTSQSGIALLLVIGAIVVLTMLTVEFAYNSQVEYHLAVRQKQRLQATYLAQSAYQLTLLELKMGNAVQSQVAQATQQMNLELPVDLSAPLCEQFPIKTGLFRMLMTGGPGEKKGEEETAEAAPAEEAMALSGFGLSGLEEFLQFEGDFEAECVDDSSRIDLNFFYNQNPTAPAPEGQDNLYDAYKKFLIQFLSQPQFQELFRDSEVSVAEIVRNIADYVDPDDAINELGRGQGGAEESIYRDVPVGDISAKNGKFSTPDEIFRVAGIRDEWWIPLSEYFTIYGMSDRMGHPQINVCRAPEAVVSALILRYLELRKDLPPLPANDPTGMKQLVGAVQEGCTGAKPDKNKIAQDLDAKLMEWLRLTPPGTETAREGGYAPTGSAFADWIATESRFYRLKLLGQVQDTVVKIDAVIDLGEGGGADPQRWKVMYWKVN